MHQYLHIETDTQPIGVTQTITTNNIQWGSAFYCQALNHRLDAEFELLSRGVRICFAGTVQDAVEILSAALVSIQAGEFR
jgi:hypothetical protein